MHKNTLLAPAFIFLTAASAAQAAFQPPPLQIATLPEDQCQITRSMAIPPANILWTLKQIACRYRKSDQVQNQAQRNEQVAIAEQAFILTSNPANAQFVRYLNKDEASIIMALIRTNIHPNRIGQHSQHLVAVLVVPYIQPAGRPA